MKRAIVLTLALASVFALAAGCGDGDKPDKPKTAKADDAVERPAPPGKYNGLTNPTPDAAEEGKKIFDNHCVLCHGADGTGDSPVGSALNPPSADLTNPALQDAMRDDYMFWRVSEGGKAMGYEGMSAFKGTLKDEQIWQVVAYVRSLKK